MSKNKTIKTAALRSLLRSGLAGGKRLALRFAVVLGSRRGAVGLFAILIAVELCVLGVGVCGHMDKIYKQATELSRMQLAAIEAQDLADSLHNGSAGISAAPKDKAEEEDPNAAPPLRARDVDMIVADLAGSEENSSEEDSATASAAGIQGSDKNAEAEELGSNSGNEVDELVRRGVGEMIAGDMRRCILSFEEAYKKDAEHPALLYYYGMAYDKLLNPSKAREYYTKLFHMRDRAGKYFERASHRLSYGFESPAAMRGKLAFGPYQSKQLSNSEDGENVEMILPVMLAPGEEIRPEDIYINIQFFDLVNGKKIEFSRLSTPQLSWEKEKPDWKNWEENLHISYAVPPLNQEELDAYGDLKYYGFTAKLFYKGEPLDCISSPSALILHEQRLNKRRAAANHSNELLPDDGLDSSGEEAVPVSDFLEELHQN